MRWDKEIIEVRDKLKLTDLGMYTTLLNAECTMKSIGLDDSIPLRLAMRSRSYRTFSWSSLEYYLDQMSFGANETDVVRLFTELQERIECCPASTKYHGSYFGGLIDHIIPVIEKAIKIGRIYEFDSQEMHSLVKVSLLHDIGKLGDDRNEMFLVNPDFSKHDKEPFIYNENLTRMPHEMYSLWWCNQYGIKLTPDEFQAIAYHNGAYHDGFKSGVASKESKLLLVLHAADNLTAKMSENTISKVQG